ncbi:aminotransferase class IV [Flavobacterium columnare]|uniref:aminotransferase class IV n=1 Tax=Flavobacterium columnare TaxID=996 RepID=UPI004033F561
MNVAYYNGGKLNDRNIISVYNGSFLYGVNVFEGIRAYWNAQKGKMFFFDLKEHLERLLVSIDFIGFNVEASIEALENELWHIFEKESIAEDVYIRITYFVDGETSWSETEKVSYVISVRSMVSNLLTEKEITLKITNVNRINSRSMPPSIKAGANYLNSRYALLEATSNGFDGALFVNENNCISESTGACVFFIDNNKIVTPSIDNDILVGVTRNRIIALCQEAGIEVCEMNIPMPFVYKFQGAFLAGTMAELKPISQIDQKKYNTFDNPVFNSIKYKLNVYVRNEI